MARIYESENETDKALKQFERAIVLYGDNPVIKNSCGTYLFSSGNYFQALEYFTNALQDSASYYPALVNRGATLIRLGRFEEALSDIETALEINGHDGVVYLNKGIALENLFMWEEACRSWLQALQLGINKAGEYIQKQCKK
jgi:tetratricopeptide (TPR) repeat protein